MKRNIILVAAAAVVALAAWAGIGRAQSSRPGANFTRLAVCDVSSVFNKYQRASDLSIEFNGRRDRVKAEDDEKLKQMDAQAAMIKELATGSKKYDEEVEKLQKMDAERQVWRKIQEQTVMRDYRLATEQMYNEINTTIAAVAKEQGFDIVLYRDSVELNSETPTELLGKIALRKVLYNDPSLDITDQVIERVNATYTKGGAKK
jgi:Skp family chaperone for outer membrane proteins